MGYASVTLHAFVAAIVGVAMGVLVYVGVSFLMMRAHTERRAAVIALRAALRELAWAALIQPLIPLFYFIGRRLARGQGTPVVVVHGYSQNRVNFLRIARALGRAGVGPVYGINYPWFATIAGNARRLARFVARVRRETGAARVDLVAHSLGGLVAMEYAHDHASEVRRIVTIAAPHAGVRWRGPIVGLCAPDLRRGAPFLVERAGRAVGAPCLSIYSTHDNIVHPPATSALAHRGARDLPVEHVGHLSILFAPEVADQIARFLGAAETEVDDSRPKMASGQEHAALSL
jgi:pimeloyl-ACP methyl ester carboxylesterase